MISTGLYKHIVDDKNRLFLPAKFRQIEQKFIITAGIDDCLYVYSLSSFKKLTDKFDSLSLANKSDERAFKRAFLSQATEVGIDKLGRILIPQNLKQQARIFRKVIIIGVGNRLEIWSEEKWKRYFNKAKKILKKVATKLEI